MSTYPEADIALPDGAWRFDPFRHVQVWVPSGDGEVACSFDRPKRADRYDQCECGAQKTAKSKRCRPCNFAMRHANAIAKPKPAPVARKRSEIPHGTFKGYKMHPKRDEPMCEPCRTAAAEHRRAGTGVRCECGKKKRADSNRCGACHKKYRAKKAKKK